MMPYQFNFWTAQSFTSESSRIQETSWKYLPLDNWKEVQWYFSMVFSVKFHRSGRVFFKSFSCLVTIAWNGWCCFFFLTSMRKHLLYLVWIPSINPHTTTKILRSLKYIETFQLGRWSVVSLYYPYITT